jgi:bifunctional ADP-heptose synthase (sugar kinase/adenylyltransferase)|tara:strand:+ start:174 stop:914 length:741 start_codon:yes stop_codon:yes gene_type:complete
MKILIFGESCKDVFNYGECDRLCPDAPVPVFNSLNTVDTYGMAKNVENNLKSLGVTTYLVTNQNYEQITKNRFIDNRTNHMFLRVDENDERYGSLKIESLKFLNFVEFDAVIVSDYNKGFLSIEVLKEISASHPLTFIDTKKQIGSWANDFSFIKLNNNEFVTNKKNITPILKKKMIVTKGPKGCIYQNKLYPVENVEVKDTSGAGDTFVAGLCYKFVETKDIERSINYANECATRVVQKRGVGVI